MSTDRELLEKAARAAGIKALQDSHGVWRDCTGAEPMRNMFSLPPWNPLESDGDALRLAVKCELDVFVRAGRWTEVVGPMTPACKVSHGDDPYAATRRAIVRAAAALGADK